MARADRELLTELRAHSLSDVEPELHIIPAAGAFAVVTGPTEEGRYYRPEVLASRLLVRDLAGVEHD